MAGFTVLVDSTRSPERPPPLNHLISQSKEECQSNRTNPFKRGSQPLQSERAAVHIDTHDAFRLMEALAGTIHFRSKMSMSRNSPQSEKIRKGGSAYHVVGVVGVILVRAVNIGEGLDPALVLELGRLVAVRVRNVVVLEAVEGLVLLEALALGVAVCSGQAGVSQWEKVGLYGLTLREPLALVRPCAVFRLVAIHADVKILPELWPSHRVCYDAGSKGSDHEAGDLVEGNHDGTVVEVSVWWKWKSKYARRGLRISEDDIYASVLELRSGRNDLASFFPNRDSVNAIALAVE
ncbi:hypothetical protein KC337_g6 [Hortaea werneckii]|nr:hypothetical protein KC337_g6 [Hortaea werneckii]